MKLSNLIPLLSIVVLCLCAVAATIPQATDFSKPQTITLSWSYPTNEMSTNNVFVIFMTTELAGTNTAWIALTNVPGTNLSCKLSVMPGNMYFRAITSNFWGYYSDPSDTSDPTWFTPKSTGKSALSR